MLYLTMAKKTGPSCLCGIAIAPFRKDELLANQLSSTPSNIPMEYKPETNVKLQRSKNRLP
jgi:hypothetical protein